MKAQDEYKILLTEAGYRQVEVTDITEDVLSGFCFWFGQHHQMPVTLYPFETVDTHAFDGLVYSLDAA